jgi:hypothetical protein
MTTVKGLSNFPFGGVFVIFKPITAGGTGLFSYTTFSGGRLTAIFSETTLSVLPTG